MNHETLTIIEETHGVALCEIETEDAAIERRFHVVSIDHDAGQVYSLLPSDSPESGRYCGAISANGVGYVSHSRTSKAARSHFLKHVREIEEVNEILSGGGF